MGGSAPGTLRVTLVVFALVLSACVGPALTEQDYRRKAIASLERVDSAAAATSIALDVAVQGRSFAASTAVTVRGHEETVSWTHSAFATRQPPPGTDRIRAATEPVLAEAAALMAEIRIAANRSDAQRLSHLRDRLDELDVRVQEALEQAGR